MGNLDRAPTRFKEELKKEEVDRLINIVKETDLIIWKPMLVKSNLK